MPHETQAAITAGDFERAARKLRDLVTTIEFTMISVIAGLMLFPWIDAATPLIRELRFEHWIYLAITLLSIMFYWAALINHALTFVGWPIDIIHNLIYLALFPIIGVMIQFIGDVTAYYSMFVVVIVLAAVLTSYDLSVIRAHLREARGAEAELFAAAYTRQRTLVRYVLASIGMSAGAAAVILAFPDFFIGQHLHLILGAFSLLAVIFLLVRECVELNGMRGRILRRAAEELALERQDQRLPAAASAAAE